jgi:DNA-binding beta-propeller fold protein YncE
MVSLMKDQKEVTSMVRRTGLVLAIAVVAAALLTAMKPGALSALSQTAAKSSTAAPAFQVDPYWPKPLPNDWLVGNVVGVAVDSKDNVWITHRPRSQAGAEKTPAVLAFDQAGNLVQSWGGKDTSAEWGTQEHGLYIDYKDNVWVGFGGGLPYDPKSKGTLDNANVLKLTPKGQVLLELGKFGMGTEGSNNTQYLGNPTDVYVDPKTDEAYVTDGYINHRVIVFNATTGAYKRLWGAFGHKPDDTPMPRFDRSAPPRQQFDTPHCITMSNDGLLYVCDRGNQRIQVFKADGTFVKDALVNAKLSGGVIGGNPWDIAMSRDAQQKYIFLVDGGTHKVHTLLRETLEVVSSFGQRGRWAGEFESPHSIAIDSKGNLYVAETLDGRRVQRFVRKSGSTRSTSAGG